jgi:hypothetical protein
MSDSTEISAEEWLLGDYDCEHGLLDDNGHPRSNLECDDCIRRALAMAREQGRTEERELILTVVRAYVTGDECERR